MATKAWATPTGRVTWLLAQRYGGSRSAMAKATGVSLTGLIKVVTGQQTPGRRLLEKIAQNTEVSLAWLYAGEGQPFKGTAIPVVTACLPGPPGDGNDHTGTEGVPELGDLYSPSRYWLKVGTHEPVVKASGSGLRAGDLLLMETDRGTFPPIERLAGRWGAVRVPVQGGHDVRLAALTYFSQSDDEAALLEADTYAHHPVEVRRFILDVHPDGRLEASQRPVLLEQAGGGPTAGHARRRWASSIMPHAVEYTDVVAVCVLTVRRFG